MKFEIKHKITCEVVFSIGLSEEWSKKSYSLQLGFAVKGAIEARADLRSANLSSADLRSANLSSANLRSADLSSADLRYADLSSADLRSANLSSANLRYANLRSADLSSANLRYADLSSANLRSADLSSADLRSADLSSADLRYADLSSANLRSADLSSADLSSADLSSADLSSAKNSEMAVAMTRILPEGDLIGWKKCRHGVIVKLRIPESAKRCHAFGRKCRAEFADVLEIIGNDHGISIHDVVTKYVAGARIRPDAFDTDFTKECSNGVHFYITRLEAEAHT